VTTYRIDIVPTPSTATVGFTYDPATKALTAVDSRCEIETGTGYFAIKANGDYLLIHDADGMCVGDISYAQPNEYPRLDFIATGRGMVQRIASLTQTGVLHTRGLYEDDELLAGMNLYDAISFTNMGTWTSSAVELWLLSDDNGDYVCDSGQLICVKPATAS
jgi:hypothetical protein